MASGTGQAKIAKLSIRDKDGHLQVINCTAYDEKYNPNAEGHSDIGTDRVKWHSSGLKEWTVDVEVEIQPGMRLIHPHEINENNPADLLIIGPAENRRYVQGVVTDEGYSFKEKETEKLKFTLGLFKNRVIE